MSGECIPKEVEITPEMIEAEIFADRGHCLGQDLRELVAKVYVAMATKAQ
jgi:hypothetical protein